MHSDSWLLSQAFFNGARLNREGRCVWASKSDPDASAPAGWLRLCERLLKSMLARRESLFFLINAEPTCYEIVSGKVVRDGNGKAKKRGAPGMAPAMGAGRPQPSNPALKAQRPVRAAQLPHLPLNLAAVSLLPSPWPTSVGCWLPGQPAYAGWARGQPDRAVLTVTAFGLQAVRPPGPQRKPRQDDDEDDEDEEEEENGTAALDDQYADGEGDPCPNCGRVYRWTPVLYHVTCQGCCGLR